MKQPNSICLACRFKLLAVTRPRPAWQPTTRLSSTAAASSRPGRSERVASAFEEQFAKRIEPQQKVDSRPKARASREGTGALDIFKNVVEGNAQGQGESASSTKAASAASLQLYKDVATLEDMVGSNSIPTDECFQFFEKQVYPQISEGSTPIPRVLRDRVGRVLMERVTTEKKEDFDSRELPSVTRIGQMLLQLGLFRPDVYGTLITHLLDHICTISINPQEYTSIESYETAMARRDSLLYDLIGAWKVLNVHPSALSGNVAKATTEARLPHLSKRTVRGKRNDVLLASLLPHHPPPSLRSCVTAAVSTYVLLSDPFNRSNRVFRAEIAPFVDAMAAVLYSNRQNRKNTPELSGKHPALHRYLTGRWSAVRAQLEEQSKFQESFSNADDDQPSSISQMKKIHRQLGQASNTGNTKMLHRAWEEFWGLVNAATAKKTQLLRDNANLFNYFIKAYMANRQTERAIEIWNCMVSVGVEPTVKTWNSLLDGYKQAKNLVGLKNAWEKVVTSGMKLDTVIWTTRISGLIELGDAKAGLLALDEMAKIWRQSQLNASTPFPAAVKPTIEPVNAALAGLLRLEKAAAANGLLSWAAKQDIRPDIYTFNTLLAPLVRKGLDGEVQATLQLMKTQNVEANVATFSILLEDTLADIGAQTTPQQIQTIKNFLRAMRDAGVTANMQLFAKIIHLLLQEGDRTSDAVNEVLAIIWGQELELTSHIYTMLADHYFTSTPPKPWAVTALIENRALHENRDIDRVFWERVISGFCQVGDTARALQSFEKIDRSGGKITFSTLYDLLLVLSRSGENQAIGRVIDVARKNIDHHLAGDQGGDAKSKFWKHRFWHLADKCGFLGEDLRELFVFGSQGGREM